MCSTFSVLAENKIVGFPDGNILSWCPQMDLLAVSMNHTSIWVFRLDGERVYSINNRAKVLHLCWSRSGKFFAVSGADNTAKVYDSNNGTVVNKFATNAELDITLVSWESIDVKYSVSREEQASPFHGVFEVDILKHMPKLANETESDVNRISPELNSPYTSISVTNTTDSDASIDFLLVVNANAWMSFTFNNLLTVTDIPLPKDTVILQHAMAPDLFCQYFLVQNQQRQLQLQELRLKENGSKRRSRIFSTVKYTAQLISITNHIQDQFTAIQVEAKEYISLFDRYLSNYKDALYEGVDLTTNFPKPEEVEDTMVEDLGTMLLTGLIPASMKDYWLNQFGERGLMRLSTVGNTAYDNIRKNIVTQLILASEKIIIILSSMEGFAKEAGCLKETYCGISQEAISNSIDCTKKLMTSLYDFIWRLNEEHEGFNQFLNWCSVEVIEKLAKEDSDPQAFFQDHPTMEFRASSIMEYLDKHLLEPAFLSILEDQVSGNEVLAMRKNDDFSFDTCIRKLAEELKLLISGFEQHLGDQVSFRDPVSLGLVHNPGSTDDISCGVTLFGDTKVVTAANKSVLSVVYIEEAPAVMEIVLPGPVISHKAIAKDKFLILYGEDEYRLELIEAYAPKSTLQHTQVKILKAFVFDSNCRVKKPIRLIINSLESKTRTLAMVLDSAKKDYIVFEI